MLTDDIYYWKSLAKMADSGRKKVIVDCDAGTDDAFAILMLLAQPHIDVVAITTVMGNSTISDTSYNTLRTLKVANRLDIPVYAGCEMSMAGNPPSGDGFHGDDALGDVIDENPPDRGLLKTEHAANALVDLVNASPGLITVLAIGPLTNISIALHLDPQLGNKLADFVIMGGNSKAKGNISVCAEFNFFSDPEAARMVLEKIDISTTLVPMELCCDHYYEWDWYDKLISMPTRKAEFIGKIDRKMTERERKLKAPLYNAWDQLAAAIVIDEGVVSESKNVYATVELAGKLTRGQMVVDWMGKLEKPHNVRLITDINRELYLKYVADAVKD